MRSKDICKRDYCTGCEACANACSHNAISMKANWQGFKYPYINQKLCGNCELCQKTCPINVKKKIPFEFGIARAFVEKNIKFLSKASSGGAFGVMARYVIRQGGIVFGASMDDDYHVNYKAAETIENLDMLYGSKYVQSYVNDAHRQVKTALKNGRQVLFCGCPCQVAGLKSFLHKDYENLITMDLICHGVPSQPYFRSYVKDLLRRKKKSGVTAFRFRWKTDPYCDTRDNTSMVYHGCHSRDYYMTYFLWGKGYRTSCYHCRFAGEKRQGDFTIGDFWNNKVAGLPIDDSHGASLVLFNTPKAQSLEPVFKKNGTCLPLKSLSDAISGDGGQLKHPSHYDIRCTLIYLAYKLFGVAGPKVLFKLDSFRQR